MQSRKSTTILLLGMVSLIVILFVGSFTRAASTKAPDSTIGYVDMERIQKEHPDFISLAELIKDKEAEFSFFQSYLNNKLEGISRDLKAKIDQEKTGKSADEQSKIEQKYQDEFQKKTMELKNQLTQKNNEITGNISQQKKVVMDKLTKMIEEIAKNKNLTLVLDKSTRFYGGIDITSEVLDKVKVNPTSSDKNDKSGK
jgi:Skp family chaperone for outer membrane proteins